MMRLSMTTSRRAEAQNGEVTGKNLSMYTMSNCHAERCKFQLHRLSIGWIGTVFHFVKDISLDLMLAISLCHIHLSVSKRIGP